MSKLSFRARALDAFKPMPVYHVDELSDLSECASINRAVPQMPTGMEKEEEMELHLQQVLSAQQAIASAPSSSLTEFDPENVVIPIPKVISADSRCYETLYKPDYRPPKQLVKIQAAFNLEPEVPDYDLDSEDEAWVSSQQEKGLDVNSLQFEKMMDRLERQSEHQVVKPEQAKTLLYDEDDDLVLAVYDYWLNKRLTSTSPFIPQVKTEKRDGTAIGNNPYFAFRRRAEKMQTRKNRKNDEESYEKMLRIRSDLRKAVTLLEMIKRREKSKREMLNLTLEIFERRFLLGDWNDVVFDQLRQDVKPVFQFSKEELRSLKRNRELNTLDDNQVPLTQSTPQRKKRTRIISKYAQQNNAQTEIVSRDWLKQNEEDWHRPTPFPGSSLRLQEEAAAKLNDARAMESEAADGIYVFKRRRGCAYQAPVESTNSFDGMTYRPKLLDKPAIIDDRFRDVYLHSQRSASGLSYVGRVRRRLGRGGRVLFDRLSGPKDIRGLDPACLGHLSKHKVQVADPMPSTSAACSASTAVLDTSLQDIHPVECSSNNLVTGPVTSQATVSNPSAPVGYSAYVFRPASPVTLDEIESFGDGSHLYRGMVDTSRFLKFDNDPMWGSSQDPNGTSQNKSVDYPCAREPMSASPAGVSTDLNAPYVKIIGSNAPVIPTVGITASVYNVHLFELRSWIHQQALTLAASDECTINRLKEPPGVKAAETSVSMSDAVRQLDPASAHYVCSAVNTTEDYNELLEMCRERHSSDSSVPPPSRCTSAKQFPSAGDAVNDDSSTKAPEAFNGKDLENCGTSQLPPCSQTSATVTNYIVQRQSSAALSLRQNSHMYSLPPPVTPALGSTVNNTQSVLLHQSQSPLSTAATLSNSIQAGSLSNNSKHHSSPAHSDQSSRAHSPVSELSSPAHLKLLRRNAVNGPVIVAAGLGHHRGYSVADADVIYNDYANHLGGIPTTSPRCTTSLLSRSGGNNYLVAQTVDGSVDETSNIIMDSVEYCSLDPDSPSSLPAIPLSTTIVDLTYPLPTPSPSPNSRIPPNGSISEAGSLILKHQSNNNGAISISHLTAIRTRNTSYTSPKQDPT